MHGYLVFAGAVVAALPARALHAHRHAPLHRAGTLISMLNIARALGALCKAPKYYALCIMEHIDDTVLSGYLRVVL